MYILSLFVLLLCVIISSAEENLDVFYVKFSLQLSNKEKGSFVVKVDSSWAPKGVKRFRELVDQHFFDGVRFFRVISGFMAQFGIHGDTQISAKWKDRRINDDPVLKSNKRGYLSFATQGKDTRTTQIFINFNDNANLDGMGFSPFAEVVSGMDVVDKLYAVGEGGQGDGKDKKGPAQARITSEGNKYLKKFFPRLSYIISTEMVDLSEHSEL